MNEKQQFNSFEEELQHDYHRYKEKMRKRQKIKFIAALPIIILMGIGIIVDSTADMLPKLKERVHIVPLNVFFGEEKFIDGVTIDNETFFNKIEPLMLLRFSGTKKRP